jgi:hypothetical protein
MRTYLPTARTKWILKHALEYLIAVPYRVTARWLFYRLDQDGTYSGKSDYKNKFLPAITRARKASYGGWAPDTLADDTRTTIWRGNGFTTVKDWVEAVGQQGLTCKLDYWDCQSYYVEIWFEAAAMQSQFEYYTEHITLRPFKGDPSVDYKWRISEHLSEVAETRPDQLIVILYFGDYDPKGLQIPESAVRDIREWTMADFEFIRCGLNPEHPALYNIPENFDKPGTYQWEALDDAGAQDLIVNNVKQWVDFDLFEEVAKRAKRAQDRMAKILKDIAENWQE